MKSKLLLYLALVLIGWLSNGICDAAIIFPKQGEAYREIAFRETISFYRGSHSLPKYLEIDKLSVTNGFKSYYLDYHLGFSNQLFSMAVAPSGWSYMLMCGTNMVGVTELGYDDSNRWSFGGSMFRGPPDPIWVGLERAKQLPQVKAKDYEFRTLSFSGDDSPMIWLHSDSDDILIPLSSGYGKWEAYKPYSESQIVKLLKSDT